MRVFNILANYQKVCRLAVPIFAISSMAFSASSNADSLSQAKRIHDRISGVAANQQTLEEMAALIDADQGEDAALIAMQNPNFYNVTLKNWITPWTNEEADIFASLNDYTATVIGIIRDDVDFREILSGDILYVADSTTGVSAYSANNNDHYEDLENNVVDFTASLQQQTQSTFTGIPSEATAGVMTTRAGARAFFIDGTNRAMLRFTLINHLCTDLEPLNDISLAPDRVRQDVSRSPGGDSRVFASSCVGCHTGMDPLAQAFAYYEFEYDSDTDPEGVNGHIAYNEAGQLDPETNSRVTAKHRINANSFPFGFIIENDNWDNYWREGNNRSLGWSESLSGSGQGAKSMGEELANSEQFAQCQVTKVFENICLRSPQDIQDRAIINENVVEFTQNGYQIKPVFAAAADYCKGE